ncbi:hypothetical protein F7230_04390 [Corynebacterium sp. 320]|uniref:hypothetical protein n=1 Tax=Corynebacterium TaxID=1716 RepID=UPI00125CC5FE|nr:MULTISPECIES: hypothetical protein [Corynebacterium]KAB1504325.1 hypothetical protein F7230_04390 [Corynebacterium sp. 320]KAB1552575.1 hypothetical protein F7233_02200 [Corynebacterium sp. 321]KAB3528461.1 hypothetical protein F8354_04390 [Corynebacterium sp. 250]QNP92001.1 hypothetical protein IAU67_08255 [Corynebacterium zhongnanshanii]
MTLLTKKIVLSAVIAVEVVLLAMGGTALATRDSGSKNADTQAAQPAGNDPQPEEGGPAPEAGSEDQPTEDSGSKLADLYAGVLDNPSQVDFSNADMGEYGGMGTGELQYALHDVNGDGQPELLLKDSQSVVRVVGANDSKDAIVQYDPTFWLGSGPSGRRRAALSVESSGSGVIYTETEGMSGDTTSTPYSGQGNSLVPSGESWNYRIDQTPGDLAGREEQINWISAGDRSALDALRGGGSGAPSGDGQPVPQAQPAQEQSNGWGPPSNPNNEVTGTIRELTAQEIVDLQGLDGFPNGKSDANRTYVVLILDSPTEINAYSWGPKDIKTGVTKMIFLYKESPSKAGKHVTTQLNPDKTTWASDAGLPLKEPRSDLTF